MKSGGPGATAPPLLSSSPPGLRLAPRRPPITSWRQVVGVEGWARLEELKHFHHFCVSPARDLSARAEKSSAELKAPRQNGNDIFTYEKKKRKVPRGRLQHLEGPNSTATSPASYLHKYVIGVMNFSHICSFVVIRFFYSFSQNKSDISPRST